MPRCHLLVTLSLSCCEVKECHQSSRHRSILCADLFTPTRGPIHDKMDPGRGCGEVLESSGAASAAQLKVVPGESCLQKGKELSRAHVSSSCSLFCCRCCCCVVFFFVTSCVSYGHQRRSLASKGELRELGSFSKAKCAGEAAASSAMLLPIHLTPVVGSLCVRPCPGVTWDPWVCR